MVAAHGRETAALRRHGAAGPWLHDGKRSDSVAADAEGPGVSNSGMAAAPDAVGCGAARDVSTAFPSACIVHLQLRRRRAAVVDATRVVDSEIPAKHALSKAKPRGGRFASARRRGKAPWSFVQQEP
mmetsp:Transcript_65606/g.182460  ORF Transcript_65606/g.182460 Transcript_65606/m.182460 type:complete len:127 (+) Transcript_65606:769-1149(+)